MDPIDDLTGERDRIAARKVAREHAVDAVDAEAAAVARIAEIPEAGNLGESESLLGVVMTSPGTSETAALRTSLELDDAPATAVPTNEEAAGEAAVLRRAVAADTEHATLEADLTEQYEIHNAAQSGDRIAQAIEAASKDEALDAQLVADRTRARKEFDAHTLGRLTLEQADADGASAARATLSETADAAQAVLATQTERRVAAERSFQIEANHADATEQAEEAAFFDRRAREAAVVQERVRAGEDIADMRADKLARGNHVTDASDRASLAAGEAATASHGAGRPLAGRDPDDLRAGEGYDLEVDAIDRIPSVRTDFSDREHRG